MEKIMRYRHDQPVRDSSYLYKVCTILFLALSLMMAMLAIHLSKPLDCVSTYEDGGIKYCISEVKK